MSIFDTKIPPPKIRRYRRRLTPLLKEIKVGQSIAEDPDTARCVAAYIRRQGGKPVTREEGTLLRVWWAR